MLVIAILLSSLPARKHKEKKPKGGGIGIRKSRPIPPSSKATPVSASAPLPSNQAPIGMIMMGDLNRGQFGLAGKEGNNFVGNLVGGGLLVGLGRSVVLVLLGLVPDGITSGLEAV